MIFHFTFSYFRYFQHGSYPVINPYNETFPDRFHTNRSSLNKLVIKNNDVPSTYVINTPREGTWFFAAFIPKKTGDSKISVPVRPLVSYRHNIQLQ